jgi:hypothetical protein
MAKKLAQVTQTTKPRDFLDILMDSYLFENRKAARYSLGASCCGWRVWMIAMTQNPPKNIENKLTIPGVGTISISWTGYEGRYAPRLKLRFRPISKIQKQIRQHNFKAYREWEEEKAATAEVEEVKNNPNNVGKPDEPDKS